MKEHNLYEKASNSYIWTFIHLEAKAMSTESGPALVTDWIYEGDLWSLECNKNCGINMH